MFTPGIYESDSVCGVEVGGGVCVTVEVMCRYPKSPPSFSKQETLNTFFKILV